MSAAIVLADGRSEVRFGIGEAVEEGSLGERVADLGGVDPLKEGLGECRVLYEGLGEWRTRGNEGLGLYRSAGVDACRAKP